MLLLLTGGLEGEEAEALRAHLNTGCLRCAGHLAEARATLDHLPLSLEPVAPSAAVRRRLLERLRAGDQAGKPVAAAPEASSETPGPALEAPARGPVLRRLWSRRLVPVSLAAALAALITYGAVSMGAGRDRQEADALRQQLAALVQERTRAEQRAAAIHQMLDATADAFGALRSPAVHVASLIGVKPRGDGEDGGWGGRLVWDRERNVGHILTPHLAPAEEGKAYSLWFITEDRQMIRAGVFNVDESGRGSFRLNVPPGVGSLVVKSGSVSYDPIEGADEPSEPLLVGDFRRPAPLVHNAAETALRDAPRDRPDR